MAVWGLALLMLASGAKSLLHRDGERAAGVKRRAVAPNWRETLAKLMADRARVSS